MFFSALSHGSACSRNVTERAQLFGNRATSADQVIDEAFINVQITLVLPKISQIVTFGQNSLDFGAQVKCLRQHLKNDVAMVGAVAVPPQGRQTQSMGGVIGQIETTFQRKTFNADIAQASQPGP